METFATAATVRISGVLDAFLRVALRGTGNPVESKNFCDSNVISSAWSLLPSQWDFSIIAQI
ncbi:MAG: hypothetical protein P4K83_08810 [Terracidiphilus sp.]|nr:hypothetical protein [Terracidiphilus sp.]